MPFLWVWLTGTADPILAEGIRSGGCSARGYLRILGPGMGLSSQVSMCLPPSVCPGLATGHSTCGYKAQNCSGALQAGGKPEEHSMETNHPDGSARALERSMRWAGGCSSLPALWGWIRLQQGRSSLFSSSTPVLLCEGKVLDSHCLPRHCRPPDPAYTCHWLTVHLSLVIWDSSPISMLSFHPSAFPPALNMLCICRVLCLDRQGPAVIMLSWIYKCLIFNSPDLLPQVLRIFFFLSHIRENKVKPCAAVAGAWPVAEEARFGQTLFSVFLAGGNVGFSTFTKL